MILETIKKEINMDTRTQNQIDEQNRINELNRNRDNRTNESNDYNHSADFNRSEVSRTNEFNRQGNDFKPYITTGNNQSRANAVRELKTQLSEMKAAVSHAIGIIEQKLDSLV